MITKKLALTSKSTTSAAQDLRILTALLEGPKTTDELRSLGCYQSPTRIFKLRAEGHEIDTERFSGISADGYFHVRMARYTLVTGITRGSNAA